MGDAGGVIFAVGICCLFLAFAAITWATRNKPVDARTVIRRCRVSLWSIQRELQKLPASREVHDLVEDCQRAQRTCDREEARLPAETGR